MNTKIITLSSALLLLSVTMVKAAELNCVKGSTLSGKDAQSECEAMGYTRNVYNGFYPFVNNDKICGEGTVIHCPLYPAMMFCMPKSPLPLIYGDGTISNYIIEGKKPVGIVFDEKNKLAVALTYVRTDGTPGEEKMEWSTETIDTPVTNCSVLDDEVIITACSTDGRDNTTAILKITTGSYPAAQAVNKYEPEGCSAPFCKKGKWFLGSVKELTEVWHKKSKINSIVYMLYRNGYLEKDYSSWTGSFSGWSSNESATTTAYSISNNSFIVSHGSKSSKNPVRPIVKY